MTRSLYAVLNVAPNADPAVIEAAYKALMKKYHPDILAGAPAGDQQKAAEINQAFQILRDPDRRARYDSDEKARLDAHRRAAMAAAGPQIYRPAQPQPQRRSRWRTVLLLLVIGSGAFYLWRDSDTARDLLEAGFGSASAEVSVAPGRPSAIRIADVDRALAEYRQIKNSTGLLGLSAFSEDCFAGQSRAPTARAFDFCVAFDQAAAHYGAQVAGDDLPQLPRFQQVELNLRHEYAARLISNDEAWISARLSRVRALAGERLLAGEVVPPVPVPAAGPPAVVAAIKQTSRTNAPARAARREQPSRPERVRRADRDFLEREGYIY